MNARIILIVGLIIKFPLLGANAGYGTNLFFVTVDQRGVTSTQIEAAKSAPECRPTADDPEGNWGDVVEGQQLSLRFDAEAFNGEQPIIAAVVVRNVSTNLLTHTILTGDDRDIKFVVFDLEGKPLAELNPVTRTTGQSNSFIPGTQYKFQSDLTKRHKMTTGDYSVTATKKVLRLNGSGSTLVKSAPVKITIVSTNSIMDSKPTNFPTKR